MKKNDALGRGLALVGTVLVWFPVAAMLVTAVVGSIAARQVRLDWLMPAELFPAALLGSALLLWAALRVHDRRALLGVTTGVTVAMFVGFNVLATVSGLASGEMAASGPVWALVVAMVVAYGLGLVAIGVAGILLLIDLFRDTGKQVDPAVPVV